MRQGAFAVPASREWELPELSGLSGLSEPGDAILRLGVALAIGLLVGLERGWRERDEPAGGRTAGIRTYGIIGLLGAVLAMLATAMSSGLVFAAGFAAFALVFSWFQMRELQHEHGFSVTGVVAGLCVFALGGLAVSADYRAAAAAGAALAGLLASREMLHGLLTRLSWAELRSAVALAVMTTVVLPVLPNRAVDPWGGFNPWEIWLFTVLTAAISYAGYVAVRMMGPARGLIVSTIAGAVVSSTAVTLALARISRSGADNVTALAGAATLAAAVSVLRVVAVVALLRAEMLQAVAPPALAAAAVLAGLGLMSVLRQAAGPGKGTAQSRNPFDLLPLLGFAVALAVVSTLAAALSARFGESSLIATSGVSALFDVDVAVLSALRLDAEAASPQAIGNAVLLALIANAAGRLLLAITVGAVRFWLPLAAAAMLAAGAGYAAYALLPVWTG